MIRNSSTINLSNHVDISIDDLYQIRQSLEQSMKLVDKYLSQHSAQQMCSETREDTTKTPEPTPVKKVKIPTLGVCMFVNKRELKNRNIETREQLEACPARCTNKAIHMKNGLLLCSRHKETENSKLEDIINGIVPVIKTLDMEVTMNEDEGPLPEGEYGTSISQLRMNPVEEAIEECTRLETLLEKAERIVPCQIGFKEVCLVSVNDKWYVIDPQGECYGKVLDNPNLKVKTKEYNDISGSILPLEGSVDRQFLEFHNLIYKTMYQ